MYVMDYITYISISTVVAESIKFLKRLKLQFHYVTISFFLRYSARLRWSIFFTFRESMCVHKERVIVYRFEVVEAVRVRVQIE